MQRSIAKLSRDCPVCLEKTGCAAKSQEGWLQVIVQLISHCAFRGKDDGGGYLSVSLHGFVKHPWRGFLEDHLSNLKYRGLITTWHDREIRAGEEWAQQIDIYLDKAQIILLLISSDFMAFEYCYGVEMRRALERHEASEARVVPILLRPVLYTDAPFAKLQMLPTSGKPVTRWRDRDSAFLDIAFGIERVAKSYPPAPLRKRYETDLPRRSCLVYFAAVLVIVLIAAGIFALLQHPTLIPLGIYLFIGLLLLIAGIVAVRKERMNAARKRWYKQRYYGDALTAYYYALLRNPSDGIAHRGMGNALYALGNYDQALDAFTQAIDCDPTPAAYAGLGDVFVRLKRNSEAVAAYEKAMELDPTVTLNYKDLIRSLRALGRKEEVEQVHARAKQLGYEDKK